jgi:hypothetical protein
MKRIYYHFKLWEEVNAGMWEKLSADKEKLMLTRAIDFTGDTELYGSYMMRVIREWVYSCEQAFTNPSMNHLAWVGHAACAMAITCPEYVTRKAWAHLSQKQQDNANAKALLAVKTWFNMRRSGYGQLFLWDTKTSG